jgi:hypothetical protein
VLFEDKIEEFVGKGSAKGYSFAGKSATFFDSEDPKAVPAHPYSEGSLERR